MKESLTAFGFKRTIIGMSSFTKSSGRLFASGIQLGIAVVTDVLAVILSAIAAYILSAFASGLLGWDYASAYKVFQERSLTLPLLAAGIVVWFFVTGHYHSRTPFWDEARRVFATSVFALLAEGFLIFSWKADGSRLATFLTWATAPFFVMLGRAILRRILRMMGTGQAKAVIVGPLHQAAVAARVISSDSHLGYLVCGTIDPSDPDEAVVQAATFKADTAVIALSGGNVSENLLAQRFRDAGYSVIVVPPIMGVSPSGMRMQYVIGQDAIFMVDKVDVMPRFSRYIKRAFDITLSSLGLILAAVPMGIVALLVGLDGGSAMFGHERVGYGGRKFRCLKFRSMATDASSRLEELLECDPVAREEWVATRKLKNDPRITRVGRFIRKTALDELPQLINVLKGEMSLVGPRPITESEMSMYGNVASLYESVRPGVTGLWQVSGRNDLSYEERVSLDTWYVRNWSPWHDIAILLKTVPALLSRRGAY